MNKSVSSIPLIKAGWLRVLIYLLVLLAIVSLSLVIYAYKANTKLPGGEMNITSMQIDPGLLSVGLFVLTLLVTYIFRRWVDRKPFVSLGINPEAHGREAIAGGMYAIFIIGISSLLLKWTGHLKWMDILFDPRTLFLSFGTILLSAFYEELIFRGYVLSNLLESFSKWTALIISALLFMIAHWNTVGFFPMVTTLIMGLILGINYLYTRNLWFSVCFHFGWKFLEGPVLGFPGKNTIQTLLQTDVQGDEMITGGGSGFEGSVILTAFSILSLIALYLFLQKKLNPQSQPVRDRK
jgi:membrane protease YdiL (CAAX protease family)